MRVIRVGMTLTLAVSTCQLIDDIARSPEYAGLRAKLRSSAEAVLDPPTIDEGRLLSKQYADLYKFLNLAIPNQPNWNQFKLDSAARLKSSDLQEFNKLLNRLRREAQTELRATRRESERRLAAMNSTGQLVEALILRAVATWKTDGESSIGTNVAGSTQINAGQSQNQPAKSKSRKALAVRAAD